MILHDLPLQSAELLLSTAEHGHIYHFPVLLLVLCQAARFSKGKTGGAQSPEIALSQGGKDSTMPVYAYLA